jgi:2-iminoacetate synthase
MEYLVDYASPETRRAGERLLRDELATLPDGKRRAELVQRLEQIRTSDQRDIYF